MGNAYSRAYMAAELKVQYAKRLSKMAAEASPLLGIIETDQAIMKQDAGGSYHTFPIEYTGSAGVSATLSNAMTNANAPYATAFNVTWAERYGVEYFSHQFLETANTDSKAFVSSFTAKTDGLINSVNKSVAMMVPRSHTGSICQISSISTGVITLSDPTVAGLIEKGQVLNAASSDGGTPRSAKGYVIATSVAAGTVTVSATSISGSAGTPTSWAADDYLLVDGDSNATIYGLPDWIPASAPGATSFFGVDRSGSDYLGGSRYDGSSLMPVETLLKTELLLDRMGSKPDTIIVGYGTYEAMLLDDAAKKLILEEPMKVKAGNGLNHYYYFTQYRGQKGPMALIVDRNMPQYKGYMLQKNTWRWIGANKKIAQITEDPISGNWVTRSSTANTFEVRAHAYIQLACNAPGHNANMTFSA